MPETNAMLPEDWRAEHLKNALSLDRPLAKQAVAFLKDNLKDQTERLTALATYDGEWWVGHHFYGMMGVRNSLRQAGFGEKEFKIDNLDDYAVGLVELALGVTQWPAERA